MVGQGAFLWTVKHSGVLPMLCKPLPFTHCSLRVEREVPLPSVHKMHFRPAACGVSMHPEAAGYSIVQAHVTPWCSSRRCISSPMTLTS